MWRTTCPVFHIKGSAPVDDLLHTGKTFKSLEYDTEQQEAAVFTGKKVFGIQFFNPLDYNDKILRYLHDMRLIITNLVITDNVHEYKTKAVKIMQLCNAFELYSIYRKFKVYNDPCDIKFDQLYKILEKLKDKMKKILNSDIFEKIDVNIVNKIMDEDGISNNTKLEYTHDLKRLTDEENKYKTQKMKAEPKYTRDMQYVPPDRTQKFRSVKMMKAMIHRRLLNLSTSQQGHVPVPSIND
jgi:hypothetical protein